MKGRLFPFLAALVLFLPAVIGNHHLSFATNRSQVDITRNGCGTDKLCLETPDGCDPNANTGMCLFMSSDLVMSSNDSVLSFELRGYSEGYIAMGLTMNASQGMAMLFVCAQNSSNNGSFFFRTARRNNSFPMNQPTLRDRNVTEIRGVVTGNIIRCEFNVPGLNFANINYTVLLGSGNVTGGSLDTFDVRLERGPLNLTDPTSGSSNPTAPPPPTTAAPQPLMITRTGCGTDKLCLETPDGCDPNANTSMCLFMSSDLVMSSNDSVLSFELRGYSEGYIAMGLTMNASQGMAMLFVCAQNSSNNGSFFFQTARRNNSFPMNQPTLRDRNVTEVRGMVTGNIIRCRFNVPGLNFANINYTVLLGSGNVTKGSLDTFDVRLKRGPLNLTDPTSGRSNPTTPPPPTTAAPQPLVITRTGCGTDKFCLETPEVCDPAGSSECLFSSVAVKNAMPPNGVDLCIELRGDSKGYIALGLTSTATPDTAMVFVCAQNSDGKFFFRTLQRNNSNPNAALTPLALNVTNTRGEVMSNVIRCTFTVRNVNSTQKRNAATTFAVVIGSGPVSGSSLGALTVSLNRSSLNLGNPSLGSSNPTSPPPAPLVITRTGCGRDKLCLETPEVCDPAGNSECLFSSAAVNNSMPPRVDLLLELRGDSEGYIALGLTSSATPDRAILFVCAQNRTNNGSFFFRTVQRNNSNPNAALTPLDLNVTNTRGEVMGNVIKCTFTFPIVISTTQRNAATTFTVLLGSGPVNGNSLGAFNVTLMRGPLNLANVTFGSGNATSNPTSRPTTQGPTGTTCDAVCSYPHALLLLSVLVLSIMWNN